jgi:hypothetical protein
LQKAEFRVISNGFVQLFLVLIKDHLGPISDSWRLPDRLSPAFGSSGV